MNRAIAIRTETNVRYNTVYKPTTDPTVVVDLMLGSFE